MRDNITEIIESCRSLIESYYSGASVQNFRSKLEALDILTRQYKGSESSQNSWQLCPKCNGDGVIKNKRINNTSLSFLITCEVCSGRKIISLKTGKPPLD